MYSEKSSIARASFSVLIVTVIAKIIGFIENAIVAAYYGTSAEIDIYFCAASISWKTIFVFFSGLPVVGLTMYNFSVKERGVHGGNRFITSLIAGVIPVSAIVVLIIYIFSPTIVAIMGSNYSGADSFLLRSYLRELSVVAFFYSIIIVLQIVLTAKKIFIPNVLTGIIQNVILIIFVLAFSRNYGSGILVVGYIISYVFQMLFICFCVRGLYRPERFSIKKDIDIIHLLRTVFPLVLAEATSEINILVDQYLASMQGEGFVSALSYSDSLESVVSSFFIQSVTSVLLAFFSELAVENKFSKMVNECKRIIKIVTIILIPISIVTVTSADKVVSLVYQRGSFNASSVKITSFALMGYGAGFIFKAIMLISKRPFMAIEDTKTPMIIAIFTVIVNALFSILLSGFWGIFGITFATTLAYIISVIIYFIYLKKRFSEFKVSDFKSFSIKIILATVVSLLIVLFIRYFVDIKNALFYLIIETAVCVFSYTAMLRILKVRELNYIMIVAKSKLHI